MAMACDNHRKLQYKHSGKDVFEIQQNTKEKLFFGQKQKRENLITRKRLKVESLDEAKEKLSVQQEKIQVEEATKLLKSGQKIDALNILHRCFARDSSNAEAFIKCEGLPLLQSCLLSSDSSILHAAAWCAINLTAADSQLTQKAMRLSPFLIQFLQGSDTVMQELCAWAIGNLAGDRQSSKETLLHQGVIPHLLNLISSPHHIMNGARTQSVLHALINLARDTSYACCRCMLENSLFTHLKILWKDVPESSELCLEIGWLTACVYSREETFLEHADQYWTVLNFVTGKLLHLSQLPDSDWKEKVMTPYLVCCGNMLGLSSGLTLLASDLPPFLPAVKACLTSRSEVTLRHTIWVLANFTAEPSCRVMVICHSDLRTNLFALCIQQNWEIVTEVLHLLEGMVRVSSEMNQLLVKQGVLGYLNNLLNHPSSGIVEQALGILEALLVDLKSLEQPSVFQAVQNLTIASFDNKLVERARALKEYLLSQANYYS